MNDPPRRLLTLVVMDACLTDPGVPAVVADDATPLHRAAVFSQDPAVVTALQDAGADPGLTNDAGSTPQDLAVSEGRPRRSPRSRRVRNIDRWARFAGWRHGFARQGPYPLAN